MVVEGESEIYVVIQAGKTDLSPYPQVVYTPL
jgi:hypothetical protein